MGQKKKAETQGTSVKAFRNLTNFNLSLFVLILIIAIKFSHEGFVNIYGKLVYLHKLFDSFRLSKKVNSCLTLKNTARSEEIF